MAIISSSVRFTLKGLNFDTLRNAEPTLFNNVFERFKGTVYEDVLTLRDIEGTGANFAGTDFVLNARGNAIGGTVQLVQGVAAGDLNIFDIRGLEIPLTDINAAIGTRSFRDDLRIWKAQFSGNDTMTLSNSNDSMRGFGGRDTLNGRGGADRLAGDGGNDRLNGGSGNDLLIGGSGKDSLAGGADDDTLKGGGGSDVFIFADGGGNDRIVGFNANDNREDINLAGVSNIEDFADLAANHMTQVDSDVVIDDGDNMVITLTNVDIADLNDADFIF